MISSWEAIPVESLRAEKELQNRGFAENLDIRLPDPTATQDPLVS